MLSMSQMGLIYAYLLKNRYVETKSRPNRKISSEEREIAKTLSTANVEETTAFNEFLEGQGLMLVEYDDMIEGIPPGGRVFVLVRKPSGEIPAFLSLDRLYEKMKLRDSESNDVAAVWFLHTWLLHLALIYTVPKRGISEVSKYVNAVFTKEVLIESVKDHLELIRNRREQDSPVAKVLLDEKGDDINRRCKGFLELMVDAGLLEIVEKDTYQQTLLSACELNLNYERGLSNLLPTGDALKDINGIIMDVEEGGKNVSD